MHPVLTLVLASSFGWVAPEAKDQVERFVAVVAAQMVDAIPSCTVEALEPPLPVWDIRLHYDDFMPLAPPAAVRIISYDWRLPYLLTKP